jgi:8-oxo-dGTP pyrophosphatase MutT (NUDIX family)
MNTIISSGICINSNNKFLLGKPYSPLSTHVNNWSIPKGKVESGENLLESAIRETYEETSLDINSLKKEYDITLYEEVWKEITYNSFDENKNKIIKTLKVFLLIDPNGSLQKEPLICLSKIEKINKPEFIKFKWATKEEASSICFKSLRKIFSTI